MPDIPGSIFCKDAIKVEENPPIIKVYIDSDILVSSEIPEEDNHEESKKFIDFVINSKDNEKFRFYTSVFTLLEVSSAVNRRTKDKHKAYSIIYRILHTWEGKINSIDHFNKNKTFESIVMKLIETGLEFNTPSGDTIHADFIRNYSIDCLATWNTKDFMVLKDKIKQLEVLKPIEFLNKYSSE